MTQTKFFYKNTKINFTVTLQFFFCADETLPAAYVSYNAIPCCNLDAI